MAAAPDVEPPWIDRLFYRPGVSDELGHFLVYRVFSSSPGPASSSGSIAETKRAQNKTVKNIITDLRTMFNWALPKVFVQSYVYGFFHMLFLGLLFFLGNLLFARCDFGLSRCH